MPKQSNYDEIRRYRPAEYAKLIELGWVASCEHCAAQFFGKDAKLELAIHNDRKHGS